MDSARRYQFCDSRFLQTIILRLLFSLYAARFMTTKIAKEFHWEMAHRLPFHTGGCQNLHGHSYKLWVQLEGEPNDKGMVVDYFDLKAVVEPLVKQLDHSFLCDRSDDVMVQFFRENPLKVNYVD
jgi:6-pyruvoyltetrahydropterin/6-carboxytetrahydropterin synthase